MTTIRLRLRESDMAVYRYARARLVEVVLELDEARCASLSGKASSVDELRRVEPLHREWRALRKTLRELRVEGLQNALEHRGASPRKDLP